MGNYELNELCKNYKKNTQYCELLKKHKKFKKVVDICFMLLYNNSCVTAETKTSFENT